MFKRYSQYSGGTCDPLVISWPKGIKARGEVRNQYHHSIDIVPTILDICGSGDAQGLQGRGAVPALRRFDALHLRCDADAPTQKKRQYYAMLGTRGIWEDGWKAVRPARPDHRQGPLRPGRVGALPRGCGPRRSRRPGEAVSREAPGADRRPGSRRPTRTWCCRSTIAPPRESSAPSGPRTNRPRERTSTTPAPRRCRKALPSTCAAARTRSSPTSRSPIRTAAGRDLRPRLALRRPRAVHQGQASCTTSTTSSASSRNRSSSPPELKPGKYTLGMEFIREGAGQHEESLGTTKLYVNDKVVAEGPMRAQPGKFTLSRRRPLHRLRQRRRRQPAIQEPRQFTGGTFSGSQSMSARSPTWISRRKQRAPSTRLTATAADRTRQG